MQWRTSALPGMRKGAVLIEQGLRLRLRLRP
jgi:hypothetical protein